MSHAENITYSSKTACELPYLDAHRLWKEFFSSCPDGAYSSLELLTSDSESLSAIKTTFEQLGLTQKKIGLAFSRHATSENKARFLVDSHTIELHPSLQGKPVEQISPYILFEIHNASKMQEFQELLQDPQTADLDTLVKEVESLEYESAKKTHSIVRKWIQDNKLPKGTPFEHIHTNFKDHYLLQQLSGHSKSIANRFSPLIKGGNSVFHGTWPRPVSETTKGLLTLLLEMKSELQNSTSLEKKEEAQLIIDSIFMRAKKLHQERPHEEEALFLLENVTYAIEN